MGTETSGTAGTNGGGSPVQDGSRERGRKCEPESGRHDVSVRRAVDARARYFCRSC